MVCYVFSVRCLCRFGVCGCLMCVVGLDLVVLLVMVLMYMLCSLFSMW